MTVSGVQELSAKLARLAKQVGGPGVGRALFEGAKIGERGVKERIKSQGLIDEGRYRAAVEAVKVADDEANFNSGGVAYAATHEFGDTRPVTPRQRRFFWAMFADTGDSMWRAMALSAELTWPARPHWRPTVKEDKGKIEKAIADALRREIASAI